MKSLSSTMGNCPSSVEKQKIASQKLTYFHKDSKMWTCFLSETRELRLPMCVKKKGFPRSRRTRQALIGASVSCTQTYHLHSSTIYAKRVTHIATPHQKRTTRIEILHGRAMSAYSAKQNMHHVSASCANVVVREGSWLELERAHAQGL